MNASSQPIFVALLASTALAGACGPRSAEQKAARPVRVQAVLSAAGVGGVRYSASIQPRRQVALAFKVGGYVHELLQRAGSDGRGRDVQQGDAVAQGTALARVREADYRDKVEQARAQVREAESSFEKNRHDLERATALFEAQSLTKPDFDAAKAGFGVGSARVDAARAQLQSAETSLRDCALEAPMDAIVLSRSVERGSLVSPGTVAFQIADVTELKAAFGVPDLTVKLLKTGQVLPVVAEALGAVTVEGRVTAIAPAADPQSRVFGVEVTIANRQNQLRPGMIATVLVPDAGGQAAASRAPAVPLSAVVKSATSPDGYAVFVVDEQAGKATARSRAVTLGDVSGNLIEVSQGLKTGERVIVTGASLLVDGESVRIVP